MLKHRPAIDLALELENLKNHDPQYAGLISMLDNATLYWANRYPHLAGPQKAFSDARHQHALSSAHPFGVVDGKPLPDPDWAWAEVVRTATVLAATLRPYGETRLSFCTAKWTDPVVDECGGVLDEHGRCRYAADHA